MFTINVYAADNTIYIDQIGNNNQLTINQTFDGNNIEGVNQNAAILHGNSNIININQYSTNNLKLEVVGDFNNVLASQNSNQQASLSLNGNSNLVTFDQLNNNKIITANINGNNNLLDIEQKGTGNHQTAVTMIGDGHSVTVRQRNVGNHNAQLNLTNTGGASTVNLTQDSAVNQTYSLTQSCSMLGGCLTNIIQQ